LLSQQQIIWSCIQVERFQIVELQERLHRKLVN
jgi:hypothetical protein